MLYRFSLIVFVLALLIPVGAFGQSGRKLPKGSPRVATPEPEPEVVVTPTKPPPKPDFTIKFVSDIPLAGPQSFISPQRLHTWTVDRLRRSTLLDVRDSGSMNRRDAIKMAKAESESFVVLVELRSDMFSSSARASTVVLTVYNPVTAKVKQTRSLAIGMNSTRMPGSRNILYNCYPDAYGEQLLLLEASIEAADTIMRSFNVPLPPLCRGTGI